MKTQFYRVSVLTVAAVSLVLCSGCQEERAQAEVPVFSPAPVGAAAEPQALSPGLESEEASPAQPAVKVIQAPAPPEDVNASAALAEVIKLANAGVSEEIMMTYITNSAYPFNINSDQIVYLNDLGVSPEIITALIQHDSLRGVAAAKNIASLPPSQPVTSPEAKVYAPQAVPDPGAPGPDSATPVVAVEEPTQAPEFYTSLAPYGSWIEVEGYGRCWQPTVAVVSPSWRPYSDRGHWLWTDRGWYWYSDYSWGWAPFHYGRWCSYPRVGWFWVPDTCWGPSWVSWRHTPTYCGWAPLPPAAVFVSGRGFFRNGVHVGVGFDFGLRASLYTFVPWGHFHDRSFYNHRLAGSQSTLIYKNSTLANNYTV